MMGETGFWKTVELESPFQGTGTDPSRKISSSGKEESSHNLCGGGGMSMVGIQMRCYTEIICLVLHHCPAREFDS